ncbi:hypothetical protein CKO25_15765 [Thiocapsa imhoffii]|uniref:DUF502 domain-containing protein n=1 Tax=Thiocapsa imhoffii TaxID=382777 RepID=A0A9X0WJU6_9GAMM|nr:DUF502 domain-containing protein [Thiocapsa imhoffii]MBK1646077.1 hypothetical protein [Thiocapsa imhoffii]
MDSPSTITHIRTLFLQGIALLAPLIITLALLFWLGGAAEQLLGALLRGLLPDAWYIPGMGLIVGIGVIFAAGLLANLILVRWLLDLTERVLDRIPLVKTIFQGLKDVAGLFGQTGDRTLGRPVVVEIQGLKLVGFVMQEDARLPERAASTQSIAAAPPDSSPVPTVEPTPAPAPVTGDMLHTVTSPGRRQGTDRRIAVYLPMSYQVGGYTVYLEPEQVTDLHVGKDQALRAVLTGGSVWTPAPNNRPIKTPRTKPRAAHPSQPPERSSDRSIST